jgi:hypothetical protein
MSRLIERNAAPFNYPTQHPFGCVRIVPACVLTAPLEHEIGAFLTCVA